MHVVGLLNKETMEKSKPTGSYCYGHGPHVGLHEAERWWEIAMRYREMIVELMEETDEPHDRPGAGTHRLSQEGQA